MTKLIKPSFPPGWVLLGKIKILKRVDKQQFVEVFSLDTGEYLYLFHDLDIGKKIKDRKLSYETFLINGIELVGKKYPDHKDGDIAERIKNILQRRGLDAIAGMSELKNLLKRDVIQPFLNWEKYEKYGITPSNGILLFGPPGCGKTFIANKLAEAIKAEIIEVTEGTVGSPYIHATSKNIVHAFKEAEQKAPCVLFIDEVSGLMPKRGNLSSCEQYKEGEIGEFLIQMESCVKKKILVIGATNYPERLDPAILRSGRIDKRIFIPQPDLEARKELFKLFLEERPCLGEIDFDKLAAKSANFVCSDIKLIVNNAALKALESKEAINMSFLLKEVEKFVPSLTSKELNQYRAFEALQRD